ncbi:MAG: P-loop NTPase fold protein [Actinophytocola sp.]|uniref:P-loop NTPase fold protein n=1 Tax=Actinophytocola sp. TaxID=1872138 RepID=UPI003C796F12
MTLGAPMMHWSIVLVEVVKFTNPGRTIGDQREIRDGMYDVLRQAFDESGIDWAQCEHEERGDCVLVLVPASVPKVVLADPFVTRLLAALRRYNAVRVAEASIGMRIVLHSGEITRNSPSGGGDALNSAFRLLVASDEKAELRDSGGMLAVIASPEFYRDVIKHEPAAEPGSYQAVSVEVGEFSSEVWLRILGLGASQTTASSALNPTGEKPRMVEDPAEAVSLLGTAGQVRVSVARTSEPWLLDIDTIVLSVGSSLGALGLAVRGEYPEPDWNSIDYGRISPQEPVLIDLGGSGRHGGRLRRAILASPHSGGMGQVTLDAIRDATHEAVEFADRLGCTRLGLPLLATGVLGFNPLDVARTVCDETSLARLRAATALREVVLLCRDTRTQAAIRAAWRDATVDTATPEPVYSDGFDSDRVAPDSGMPRYSDDLAGGFDSDRVDPNLGIPLYKDQLGLAPYVSMLAAVVADRTTPLPLSVGIFGEWGAGKSYFMGLLRQRIDDLAGSGTYCGSIMQIGFNAWHYADSNLWASLGDEIFRQLAGPGPDVAHDRRRLRDELSQVLSQRDVLKAATEHAETEVAVLRARVDEAARQRTISIRDLLGSPSFRDEVGGIWRHLGIDDEEEQGRLFVEQLHGSVDEAHALRRLPWVGRVRTVLAVAAVLVFVVLVAALQVPQLRSWLATIGGGLLATALAVCVAVTGAARSGLRKLRRIVGEVTSATPELLDGLRRAEAEQQVAQAQLDEVVSRVGELGRQLAELNPGQRLYSFLVDRARGDAYAGSLGLISTIRKDFEQLIRLLKEWRDHPTPEHQPIDRIVLYIDDLDRCDPEQVVNVLQAVHLLLALDLFVVVVGVDPRWLARSVGSHYRQLLDEHPGTDGQATPTDYLEKIFNIPMLLPRMSPDSLHDLLRSMAGEHRVAPSAPPAAHEPADPPPPSQPLGQVSKMDVEEGSEVDTQDAGRPVLPRPLTDRELTLLAALDPLIETPRAGKRLMNLYRMVRATRDLSDSSRFIGTADEPGEHEAVALLLGVLTAHAHLLGRLLDAQPDDRCKGGLLRCRTRTSWGEFVNDLEPTPHEDGWRNLVRGPLEGWEVATWTRLHTALTRIRPLVRLDDIATFQAWAPRIRWFCYVLPREQSG